MKLKTPEIEIPPTDPFRNDLLERQDSAVALTELICSTNEPLVLSINASWGEGKTTFLKMWHQMLNNKEVKTLYFNAWVNDFSEDAFVSLIGELELGIDELSLQSPNESKVIFQKAKKFAASLMKRSIPTAIKLATAGLVDINELADEALAEYSERFAEEQVKRYEDSKKSVEGFKSALSELAAVVTTKSNAPLVILIDELDRCRPPYAIKVLEAVKHFFSVQNVVFVLAIDRTQLGHSICSMYGIRMDVSGYLRRFIDIDYNLPRPKKGAFSKTQFSRLGLVDLLKKRTTLDSQYDLDNLSHTFTELFEVLGCSLREQERSFALLSLAIRTTPDNYHIYPVLLGALIILKINNHELYQEFINGKKSYEDVLNFIGATSAGKAFLCGHHGTVLEAYLSCCTPRRPEFKEVVEPYRKLLNSSDQLEKVRTEKILKILEQLNQNESFGVLKDLVNKIDLVSNFKEYAWHATTH